MSRYFLLWTALLLGVCAPAAAGKIPNYDGQSVAHWQAILADTDAKVRRKAAYALGQIGPQASAAVPALGTALGDRQLEVAWYVADALGRIGPAAVPAVEGLVHVIEETPGDEVLRRNAVIALGRIGPGAKTALPVLEKLLKSDDAETRVATAVALGQIDQRQDTQQLLIAELKPAGGPGPLAAALALSGFRTTPAANALIAVLDSPDADLRRAAVEGLGRGGSPAIAPLIAATDSKNQPRSRQFRVGAIDALGGIANVVRQESNGIGQEPAIQAGRLERIVLVEQRLVPALIERLADPDEVVQAAAARAVAKAGHLAVPDLVAALLKPDARTAAGARLAVGQLTPYLSRPATEDGLTPFAEHKQLLPQLITALGHRELAIRAVAFRLFAELGIGKSGAAAAAALRAGLSDPDPDIRRHAAAALARLEQP